MPFRALQEIEMTLQKQGIETEILQIGSMKIHDCIGCGFCTRNPEHHCVFRDDIVNEWIEKVKEADGFVFGSPVYFAHPTGQLLALMDCLFYAVGKYFRFKPAACIVTARRAGTTSSQDVLNKYLLNACMPIVSSTYWNMVFGNTPDEIEQDTEGLQTMRQVGDNMAWLLKCIVCGKQEGIYVPSIGETIHTNFIRKTQ